MNNDIFRPVLNPFTILLQLIIIILFGGLLIYGIWSIFMKPSDFISLDVILPGIFLFFFFSYIGLLITLNLINAFKFVTFRMDEITVFYPLRFNRERFDKRDIRGFTTCKIRYDINSVILYTNKNELIEVTNKDIFDFKGLSKYLELNFRYLGEEEFLPNTWIGRKYKYKNE